MSAFSAEWLFLREPIDARSRDAGLLAELAGRTAERESLSFVDLGCGTGANLRAMACAFPAHQPQSWRLLDHDAGLLAQAEEALCGWADGWDRTGEGLELRREGRAIRVTFGEADLARDIESVIAPGAIVTAAAFFDLASADWIGRFARAAARAQALVYAALTYNGVETWSPPHSADGPMLRAFHAHQRRDKGFGAAAGPDAATALSAALSNEGYNLRSGGSAWRLGARPGEPCLDEREMRLIEELAKGSASAVAELGSVDGAAIAAWLENRRGAASCFIGHTDILAWPQS